MGSISSKLNIHRKRRQQQNHAAAPPPQQLPHPLPQSHKNIQKIKTTDTEVVSTSCSVKVPTNSDATSAAHTSKSRSDPVNSSAVLDQHHHHQQEQQQQHPSNKLTLDSSFSAASSNQSIACSPVATTTESVTADIDSQFSLHPANSSPPTSTGSLPGSSLQLINDCFTDSVLHKLVSDSEQYVLESLAKDASQPNMIPSCLKALPTGQESGTFWSIDLGGSTFRVALVTLNGREPPQVVYQSKALVPDAIKQGKGLDFFKWMAARILAGVESVRALDAESTAPFSGDPASLSMGLSWSFPIKQTVLNKGEIRQMGKGYTVGEEICGWDLKERFETAMSELGLSITVAAVVNDGAASMISHAFQDQSTRISLILGTGINAGVMFPMSVISKEKLRALSLDPSFDTLELSQKSCLVNTEISMLGSAAGIPETVFDIELDSNLELPGFQPLETKVSGRYLGEVSRLVIKDMILRSGLCSGRMPQELEKPYSLASHVMADIERSHRSGQLESVRSLMKTHMPFLEQVASDMDLDRICAVFNAVSSRSAAYTAAVLIALAAVVDVDKEGITCTVAYTGSVIEQYPEFHARCQAYLDLLGSSRNIKLLLHSEKDGSLVGPAVAAAMHFE